MPNKTSKPAIFLASFIILSLAKNALAFEYKLEFPFPGVSTTVSDPGSYVASLFSFGLVLVGFLAVAAIAVGGVIYMTGGTIGKVEKGKEIILGALTGVLLLLCSYLLLNTIDPGLTNLSLINIEKEKYNIPQLVQQYDLSQALIQGKTAEQIIAALGSAKIAGSGGTSCSITSCGSQAVQGNFLLSTGAAANFLALQSQIQKTLTAQGLPAKLQITSTVSGTHSSACHTASSATGGTCADFVIITSSGQNIKNLDQATQQKYIQAVVQALNNSSYVNSCLNEYAISTKYSTGGHFHCNL